MSFPSELSFDSSIFEGACSPKTLIILGCLLVLNLITLVIHAALYCRRVRSPSSSNHSVPASPDHRAIQKFQSFFAQHDQEWSSSIVIPTMAKGDESRDNSTELPSLSQIPEQINCVEVMNHRKIFIGRVAWCGREAFLKECINPMELQLHRRLSHDNIVQFYWSNMVDKPRIIMSSGVECGRHLPLSFYCMEYCRGQGLNAFLVNVGHNLCLKEILGIILNVVSGLKYLHDRGVAHRDVKCDNVMVQTNGQIVAKIGDFDHAIESNTELNHHERVCFGSPLYTAPEFLLNAVTQPGYEDYLRHDVFSLGLLMWECLTWARCRHNTVPCLTSATHQSSAAGERTPLLQPPSLLPPRINSACHAPSSGGITLESTHDLAQYKSLVNCSSTVHIALILQLCTSLNLKYNKKEKVLKKKGVWFTGDRLIDRDLMKEFYSKKLHARPKLFPVSSDIARVLNMLLEECWRSEPRERWTVANVYKVVAGIMGGLHGGELVARREDNVLPQM